MAVSKWASTGLGWGGGLSRLRTRCSPLGATQHSKTAPRRHTALPASLFLLLKGCTMAILRRLLLAAGRARAGRASARARLAKFERVLPPGPWPPQGCRAADQYSPRKARAPAALAAAPAAAALAAAALAGEKPPLSP